MNQENIIGIKLTDQLNQKKDVVKKLLQDNPNVRQVSFSQYYPGKTISEWGTNLTLDGEKKEISFNTFSADARLFDILGLELKMGRFYSDDLISDKGKIVVNETFLKAHNISNPIGGVLEMTRNGYNFEIIGVVKDFHYQSVNLPIAPLAIRNEYYASYCMVSLRPKILIRSTVQLRILRKVFRNYHHHSLWKSVFLTRQYRICISLSWVSAELFPFWRYVQL